MSRTHIIIIWAVLITSLCLSIVAVCRTFERIIGFDYSGIIVGTLSILVTCLIGWQIFDVIKIEKVKEQTLSARDEILSKTTMNLLMSFHCLADFYFKEYLKNEYEGGLVERNAIVYGALLYRIMEIDLCVQTNNVTMYNSSVSSINTINTSNLPIGQKKEFKNRLSTIPKKWQTDDFLMFYHKFD